MKTANLITLPNPNLRKRSSRVGYINDDIKNLVETMKRTTLAWEDARKHEVGVALAAVQINDLKRVVIVRNDFDNKQDRSFKVFINPEITKYEGEVIEDFEGCLSIKDIYGKVPRYSKVRIKALDENGKEIRLKAQGFLARVFQHEIDHTNGKVFVDHIKESKDAFYTLTTEGKLEKLDYETAIAKNRILWK